MKRVLLPLLGSFAIHGVVAAAMGSLSRHRPPPSPPQQPVTIDVVEAPPKEEPKAPEPPPKPVPMRIARAPRAKPAELPRPKDPLPPPPKDAPPPPTAESKDKTPQPVVITGITMESTTGEGSIAAPVGNTMRGDPGRTARDPAAAKPYKAERYAPAAQVSELPRVLNRDALDIRKFYPPDALRREFEGDVVLRLLIDSDGSIAKVDVVSDPGEGLGAAATRAVREFRFAPGQVNGEAVATTIPFTIRFVIN